MCGVESSKTDEDRLVLVFVLRGRPRIPNPKHQTPEKSQAPNARILVSFADGQQMAPHTDNGLVLERLELLPRAGICRLPMPVLKSGGRKKITLAVVRFIGPRYFRRPLRVRSTQTERLTNTGVVSKLFASSTSVLAITRSVGCQTAPLRANKNQYVSVNDGAVQMLKD